MSSLTLLSRPTYPPVSVPAMFQQAAGTPQQHHLPQQEQKVWLLGYGSLMEPTSLSKTAEIAPEDKRKVTLTGWQRVWDAVCTVLDDAGQRTNVVFLNLMPTKQSTMTAVALHVTEAQAEAIDKREKMYHFVDVGNDVTSWKALNGDNISEATPKHLYVAVADADNRLPAVDKPPLLGETLIPKAYVKTVEAAFKALKLPQAEYPKHTAQVKQFDYTKAGIVPPECEGKLRTMG